MASIEDKLAGFSALVLDEANKKCAEIVSQNEKRKKREMDSRENEYLYDAYAEIQRAVSKHSKENNERVLKVEMTLKKELLLRREQIIDEVFGEVIEKFKEFTKTEKYKKWLLEKLVSACEEVGKGKKTVYVTAEDMKYKAELEAELDTVTVKQSDDAELLGGAWVYNDDRRVFMDLSVKQMLEEQKHLFLQTSGLTVG